LGQRKRIAIIGAGMGGLSAAAILSRHGDVTVFERATRSGGKIRQVMAGGQAIDSGPTVFTMDWALERVFGDAGARLSDHLTLERQDILARHYWADGLALDLHADEAFSAQAIADVFGAEDGKSYRAFCAKTKAVFETLKAPFLESEKPSFFGLMTQCSPIALLGTAPFSTLWSELSRTFRAPHLRQLFGRYATYCGASPFQAPATLMLVAHVEQTGVWAVKGGMQAVPDALERVARANGACFEYGVHVSEIAITGGAVRGVRIGAESPPACPGARGPVRPFDMVVMNGDAAALSSGDMGGEVARHIQRPRGAVRSQSAMTWSMLAEPRGAPLSYHTVLFSGDYPKEFEAVFGAHAVPGRPTVYICAPDRAGGRVPQAPERLFCLINAPPNGDTCAYSEEMIQQCRQTMIDQASRCGVTLNPVPGTETVTTPETFARMFPSTGGGLYGMASHGWQASFQRPGVKSGVSGLYLAGGSAHPGPGVPMAALSGRAAATALIRDYGLTVSASTGPSPLAAISGGISTR